MSRHKSGLIAGLVLLVAGLFALVAPVGAAHTDATANCAQDPSLTVGDSPSQAEGGTGGKVIRFSVDCQGKGVIHQAVEASVDLGHGDVRVFKAEVDKQVSGNLKATEEIHLPPLPATPRVCVTINGKEHCVPPR